MDKHTISTALNTTYFYRPYTSELDDRTHYLRPDTMKLHKSRVSSVRLFADGLFLAACESVPLTYDSPKRVHRVVVFDLLGNVAYRPESSDSGQPGGFRTSALAWKDYWNWLGKFDVNGYYRDLLTKRKAALLTQVNHIDELLA